MDEEDRKTEQWIVVAVVLAWVAVLAGDAVKHRRRLKPQRRQRARRVTVLHLNRILPARLFRIYPDKEQLNRVCYAAGAFR